VPFRVIPTSEAPAAVTGCHAGTRFLAEARPSPGASRHPLPREREWKGRRPDEFVDADQLLAELDESN